GTLACVSVTFRATATSRTGIMLLPVAFTHCHANGCTPVWCHGGAEKRRMTRPALFGTRRSSNQVSWAHPALGRTIACTGTIEATPAGSPNPRGGGGGARRGGGGGGPLRRGPPRAP